MSQLLSHFNLTCHPFAQSTPPKAVLHHRGFVEAYRRLLLTLEIEGISLLLAESGCGKSLLLGVLADSLQKDARWNVLYYAHTTTGPFGLTNVIARKLGISPKRSRPETAAEIFATLENDPRETLLVIDEAHNLPDASLEEIRLLTITNFDRKSPFDLLLAALPEIDDRLQTPPHRPLDQRITTFARLGPLTIQETHEYLQCRLAAAGAKHDFFDDGAIQAVHDNAEGVPRRINFLATTALFVAAARTRQTVGAQDVLDAVLDRGRT